MVASSLPQVRNWRLQTPWLRSSTVPSTYGRDTLALTISVLCMFRTFPVLKCTHVELKSTPEPHFHAWSPHVRTSNILCWGSIQQPNFVSIPRKSLYYLSEYPDTSRIKYELQWYESPKFDWFLNGEIWWPRVFLGKSAGNSTIVRILVALVFSLFFLLVYLDARNVCPRRARIFILRFLSRMSLYITNKLFVKP